MMRKRKPTDLIQLKIRMTEAMRAALEEEANRRGTSINGEVVYRLDRSFDRNELLAEVLSLRFGRRLSGLMLALGFTMALGATGGGERSVKSIIDDGDEDWTSDARAYHMARAAAHILLDLWEPPVRAATKSSEPDEILQRTMRMNAVAVVGAIIQSFNAGMQARPTIRQMIELLGPIADGMIERYPQVRKAHEEALEALDRMKRKDGTLKKKRA